MNEILQSIINHFFDYEFLYIFLIFSLIFLVCEMFIQSQKIKLIFVILFSFFLSLTILEFILSINTEKIGSAYKFEINSNNTHNTRVIREVLARYNNSNVYLEDNAIDDFMSKYNQSSDIIYDIEYTKYNESGIRYTFCNKDSDQSYIFLGCSFVFGDAVGDEQTLPYYFSKLNGFKNNILNLGYSGHSTNSALSILNSDLINNFTGKSKIEHFFYLVMQDHIQRNFRMPGNEPSDSWLYFQGKWNFAGAKQPFGKIKSIFKRSFLFRRIFLNFIDEHNQDFYEDYLISSLHKMDKTIREKYKSQLTVIIWSDIRIKRLIDKLKTENLDYIILSEDLHNKEHTIPYDFHPNAKAYEETANILYNHITKDKK